MRKNKRFEKFALTVFLIMIFQNSFSQENYIPGKIIQLNGDTLHGFVDYRYWDKNPDKIFFKKAINDEKSKYTPLDIKGFIVNDVIYMSAIIETEISPSGMHQLEYDERLKIETETTFLQNLVNGEKSLFIYMNNQGKQQFYIFQDSVFKFLVYKKYFKKSGENYLTGENGNILLGENKRYMGQLAYYLKDCPDIMSKIENTEYKLKSIEDLFNFYYDCTQPDNKLQKKKTKSKIDIGVVSGMSVSSLKFHKAPGVTSPYIYLSDADYKQSMNFSLGLYLDASISRNKGRWSVYNELLYSSYKITGYSAIYENPDWYTITNTTFSYSYLKLNNMLRFKYPVGKINVFINAGLSNGYAILEKNNMKQVAKFYTMETSKEDKALTKSSRYERGYLGGLGARYNRYSFEARYERGDGMSRLTNYSSSTNRFFFLIGYLF